MEIDFINQKLKELFGDNIYGESRFRIVFSDNQREIRYGEFSEFYGKIFIRTTIGFHERKKYPVVRERWILERWYPAEYYARAQIILPNTCKGDYELIYIFEDKYGNELPPVLWAAEIACNLSLKSTKDGEDFKVRKLNLVTEEEKKREKEEIEVDDECRDSFATPIELGLREGEAVKLDYNKERINWNDSSDSSINSSSGDK